MGSKCVEEWGIHYISARYFGDGLSPCAITFGDDVEEAYHITGDYLAGCTGDLVWGLGLLERGSSTPATPNTNPWIGG